MGNEQKSHDMTSNARTNAVALPTADVAAFSALKLPDFWQHSPRQWFVYAEAMFEIYRVITQSARINHVIAALDEQGVCTIMDLLVPRSSYDFIKLRLIEAYEIPLSLRYRELLQPGGMGDRRPSQLLREMRSVLPEGFSDAVLKEFWMQKLPFNVQMVAASLDFPLDALATRADRVFEVCKYNHQVDDIQATHDRIESLEATVKTLTQQIKDLRAQKCVCPIAHTCESQGAQQNRRLSPPSANISDCYYHNRYGSNAKKCKPPCAFQERPL